jgi:bile acid:Na+ symporter, BASS family
MGPLVIIGLFILIVLFRFNQKLKGFTYTLFILMAAVSSLIYPEWFLKMGGIDMTKAIVPLLMLIMFGMGTTMSYKDFFLILKMPKAVFLGLFFQFSIMPLIGFGLAIISGLPNEIAAGMILVGCSPSGLASNVMSYLSKANLALSITLTTIATLVSPVVTPFLMKIFADQFVPIDFSSMLWSIVKMVLLPVVAGLTFNYFAKNKFGFIKLAMPIISMGGITLIIAIITASGRDALLSVGYWLILLVFIHNILGYLLGYLGAYVWGLDKASCRALAFEVGMQNSGLASGLAVEMGRIATMGLAPAIFGPLMNTSASILATFWKKKSHEITL